MHKKFFNDDQLAAMLVVANMKEDRRKLALSLIRPAGRLLAKLSKKNAVVGIHLNSFGEYRNTSKGKDTIKAMLNMAGYDTTGDAKKNGGTGVPTTVTRRR